jgi:erythromycin esterase
MRRALLSVAFVAALLSQALAQGGNSAWVSWARDHHHPFDAIRTFDGDSFSDLQFLKTTIKDRRIVQLGESGHGVAEFNSAKVRLIKFLHQQMGFDVIAFESGMYECYQANNPSFTAFATMRNCIFSVWHTEEVRALFEYIRETQTSSRPLILAGFDTQLSSSVGAMTRPAFFARVMRAIDPQRASTVETNDTEFLQGLYGSGNQAGYVRLHRARLTEFYGGLELFFRENRARLNEAVGAPLPMMAERAAWSMLRYMEQLIAFLERPNDVSDEGGSTIRDFGMANNFTFLANDLYPGRKIMAWAHNYHIRHDNQAAQGTPPTMGYWLRERFRNEMYTIGLYMDAGSAANNNRTIYSITRSPANYMEWIMTSAGPPALFIDFLHQSRVDGNSWMFEPTRQRDWGRGGFFMIPRDQYDGVLFIDTVSPPAYITQ